MNFLFKPTAPPSDLPSGSGRSVCGDAVSNPSAPPARQEISGPADPAAEIPRWRRYLYGSLGIFFVILGGIGALLPVIPTVIPLFAAAWFFARSWPSLDRILIRNRFFRRFHYYLDQGASMPLRARLITVGLMWISIAVSGTALFLSDRGTWWLYAILIASGVLGSWVIFRIRCQMAGIGNREKT